MPSNSRSSKTKNPASSASKTVTKAKVTPKKATAKKSAPSGSKKSLPTSLKGKVVAMRGELKVGSCAPAFSLPNEKGQMVKLSELRVLRRATKLQNARESRQNVVEKTSIT